MTHHHPATSTTPEAAADVHDVVARVLSRTGTALASTAAQHEHADGVDDGSLEREARAARRAEKHAGRAPKGAKASDREPASENA